VPGSALRHYSPATPLNIVPGRELPQVINEFASAEAKVAVLGLKPPSIASAFMTWINAGARPDIYGRNLYTNLRTLDKSGARMILVEEVPEGERWDAVRDRLKRAASAENVVTYDPDVAALRADMDEDFL
jgi:L-threonylcarbamoyladenylate synthase